MMLTTQSNWIMNDLVACWPLGETSGTIAHELQGRHPGVVNGSPTRITGKSGHTPNALDFAQSISKYVNIVAFSDFEIKDGETFRGEDTINEPIKGGVRTILLPISLDALEYKELVKIERLVILNSEIVKMVVYVWG